MGCWALAFCGAWLGPGVWEARGQTKSWREEPPCSQAPRRRPGNPISCLSVYLLQGWFR